MFLEKRSPGTGVLLIVFAFTVVMGILIYLYPPAIFPDPAWGLQTLRSMQMGSGFNMLVRPDQANISKNTAEFLTWWSPGQYLVPWFFKWILGTNSGHALSVTITVCQLTGLLGFYSFFRKIGFNSFCSSASILFIACQQAFMMPYIFYNGGELLVFAFAGWFLYGCTLFKNVTWQLCLFVLISGWLGFFFKSSVMWIYIAGLLFLWLRLSLPKQNIIAYIKNGFWIGFPAIIALSTIYFFFLSKGQNPASVSGPVKLGLTNFTFPLASPLLSGFSADDLANGFLFHSGAPIFSQRMDIVIISLLAIISLFMIYFIVTCIPNTIYRLLILIFYSVSVIFFSYAYTLKLAISFEARHFRLIGIIITPGVVYLIGRFKVGYRLFCVLWLGIAYSSLHYMVKGISFNKTNSAHGITGISHPAIDQTSLNYLLSLDLSQRNAIFVFTENDIGLEIQHNRIITLEQISDYGRINIEDYEYDGHAGSIYILLPANYGKVKAGIILKFFPDYKNFTAAAISPKYILYSAR